MQGPEADCKVLVFANIIKTFSCKQKEVQQCISSIIRKRKITFWKNRKILQGKQIPVDSLVQVNINNSVFDMGTGKQNFNSTFSNGTHILFVFYYTFNFDAGKRIFCLVKGLASCTKCFITAKVYKILKRKLNTYVVIQVFGNIFLTEFYKRISQNLFERFVGLGKKVNVIKMNCCFCVVGRIFYTFTKIFGGSFRWCKKFQLR